MYKKKWLIGTVEFWFSTFNLIISHVYIYIYIYICVCVCVCVCVYSRTLL